MSDKTLADRGECREALVVWDFQHSKKRTRVYIDNRWHHQCQCGETFLTMQEFYDHRIDRGVALFGGAA